MQRRISQRGEAAEMPGGRKLGRPERGVAVALALYAVLTPLVVSAIVALRLGPFLPPQLETLAFGAALLGPGLAAVVVALRGLGTIVHDLTEREDTEPEQAVIRLFLAGAVLVYLGCLAALGVSAQTLLPLLAVDIPGILCAWLFFIHLLVHPAPSLARRAAAMISDAAFISVFLHVGDAFAAPWFSLYLWVVLGFGFRFGLKSLAAAAGLCIAGFATVFATTPFWQERPAVAGGLLLALLLLPSYVAALARRLMRAKTEAEEANAAKSHFLAVMSHELRTPLSTLLGTATLFGRTSLDAEQRDLLATIQLSARALLGLANDLLDFSKLEAGKYMAPVQDFVLHETLGAAVALLRPQAEAKGLALTLRIDPRLPYTYRGRPLQLRQMLTNLLGNAIKFTPRGRVAVSAMLLDRDGDTVRLRLAVQDSGVGIPAAARERIFEVFAQADDTIARHFGGSGLGLAIAKQLAEMMDGTIAVESEVGKGSTFTVEVPLRHDPAGLVRPPDLTGRRLLLVTPDNELAALLQARLKAWHGDVEWYAEGDTALDTLDVEYGTRPVLLLDGRDNPLAALSLAHRVATAAPQPALVLFIAPPAGSDAVAGVAAGQLTALIEAPLTEAALASALLGMLADGPAAAIESFEVATPAGTRWAAAAGAHSLKVLVADDNAANGKVLKNLLEAAGHAVELVSDGEAALVALERSSVDLALLDINMPEVSGYEVAKLFRMGHVGEARLPIIALTADTTSETERLCREAGMDAVLTKPVEARQLLAAIDEIHADRASPQRTAAGAPPVVTPISAHPRFMPEAGVVLDESTVGSLRALGGDDFMLDVIETFRKDACQLLARLGEAVEGADVRAFRECVHSLKSGAANIGAVRLCQALTALRDIAQKDLRQAGAACLEKIEGELARLDAALEQMTREQRSG